MNVRVSNQSYSPKAKDAKGNANQQLWYEDHLKIPRPSDSDILLATSACLLAAKKLGRRQLERVVDTMHVRFHYEHDQHYVVAKVIMVEPDIPSQKFTATLSPGLKLGTQYMVEDWMWDHLTLPLHEEDVEFIADRLVEEIRWAVHTQVIIRDRCASFMEGLLGESVRRPAFDPVAHANHLMFEQLCDAFEAMNSGYPIRITFKPETKAEGAKLFHDAALCDARRWFWIIGQYSDILRAAWEGKDVPDCTIEVMCQNPITDIGTLSGKLAPFIAKVEVRKGEEEE